MDAPVKGILGGLAVIAIFTTVMAFRKKAPTQIKSETIRDPVILGLGTTDSSRSSLVDVDLSGGKARTRKRKYTKRV